MGPLQVEPSSANEPEVAQSPALPKGADSAG
jgi:hypothetical protein